MTAEAPSMTTQLAGTALALVFVLALAWLALRGLKRLQQRGGTAAHDAPQLLHSTGLGPRERLVMVRWRGRDYLLGVAAGSVTFIDHRSGEANSPTPPVH